MNTYWVFYIDEQTGDRRYIAVNAETPTIAAKKARGQLIAKYGHVELFTTSYVALSNND